MKNVLANSVDRRSFLKSGLAGGAGLMLSNSLPHFAVGQGSKMNDLNVAIFGTGAQGQVLIQACSKIPGLNFVAACDIWDKYNLRRGVGILRSQKHQTKPYTDFRELLEKEQDIDAVIVATPDFWHAPMTNEALRAGKHVYCEKMMSNTHEGAVSMVKTAAETGKLLQIGHQRRSNPRYLYVKEKLLDAHKLCGRITNINGQWNRAVSEDLGVPRRTEIDDETLKKWGYKSMHQFRNWRWFKGLGGGPISDLGAHQIDIYSWFLGANPKAVTASGGVDYYTSHEWHDNVMAIYEYDTATGPVRAFYQVLTTTSAGGGYFEYFMGTEGAIKMSENPKYTTVFREARAPDWSPFVNQGLIKRQGEEEVKPWEKPKNTAVDVRETAALDAYEIPVALDKYIHQPHLENFFNTIRGEETLNCPGHEALQTEAAVLKVNEAIDAQRRLTFGPEDFHA